MKIAKNDENCENREMQFTFFKGLNDKWNISSEKKSLKATIQ